jgi:hypothetical protein
MAFGGKFLFFGPSVYMAGSLLVNSNPWLAPGYSWLLHSPFLVFPFFMALTSLIFLLASIRRTKRGRFSTSSLLKISRDNIFGICHILNFVLMFILQLLGRPSFQLSHYATYLIPTAFLSAGEQLAASIWRLSKRQYKTIALVTICLLISFYIIYYHTQIQSAINLTDSVWYAVVGLAAGAICLWIPGTHKLITNALFVALAFLFFAATDTTLIAVNPALRQTRLPQMEYCACENRQQNFLAVIKSDDIVNTTSGNPRFWYNLQEPQGGLYRSICSTHLWAYNLINEKFPAVVQHEYPGHENLKALVTISPGTDIVVLSTDKDTLLKANNALNQLGLKAVLIKTEEVEQGSISFTMTFIKAEVYWANQ